MTYDQKVGLVPLWQRTTLTLEEATAYSGIGRDKLIEISDDPDCDFILWVGKKRLIKREKLDRFIDSAFSIYVEECDALWIMQQNGEWFRYSINAC